MDTRVPKVGRQEIREFPDHIERGEMTMRIREWRLLGYDVGRVQDYVVVGYRRPLKPENVSSEMKHGFPVPKVRWNPDWDPYVIYQLIGKFGWRSVKLKATYIFGLLVKIEKQGPEGFRVGTT